jgi:hypothetical protein
VSRLRQLNGLAHNIAFIFTRRCRHFAFLTIQEDVPVVTIDLLAGTIQPSAFESDRNLNLVSMYTDDRALSDGTAYQRTGLGNACSKVRKNAGT